MTQREVTDTNNTRWTCVQAYSSIETEQTKQAAVSNDNSVAVVCTPSGGAQTVRVQLLQAWETAMNDKDLLKAIEDQRK